MLQLSEDRGNTGILLAAKDTQNADAAKKDAKASDAKTAKDSKDAKASGNKQAAAEKETKPPEKYYGPIGSIFNFLKL